MDVIKTILPEYLCRRPGTVASTATDQDNWGWRAKIWEKPTMDRLIALSKAMAKRYDKRPLFEMVFFNETTCSFPESGFTLPAYHDQLERWFEASRKRGSIHSCAQCELLRLGRQHAHPDRAYHQVQRCRRRRTGS